MNPIRIIINRKTLISMLFIGLTLLGFISYEQLPVELYPNAELPLLIVQVGSMMEVDPSYMENQGIIPLEGAITTLEGIEEIESYASPRRGAIFIYYNQDTDIKYAYLKLQEKVDAVKNNLPETFSVFVLKIDTEQIANQFMGLQVRGSGGVDRVRNVVDQKIIRDLENIDGIANVEVFGGRQKTVEIILAKDACDALGITPYQVRSIIRQSNQQRTFVGQVKEHDRQYFVNVTAEVQDIRDLENVVIRAEGPILLKDVAELFMGVKEESSLSRVNGKDAVTIQLIRDAQVNLIDLSHTTQRIIDGLNRDLKSQDIEIVIQSNTADNMEKNINLIIQLALIGGGLAVVVLWMFLRNLRLVLTITLAIPISIFTAFNFFYAFGITINSLTLVGMALAVGMLLDNSVVVLENIYRHASRKASLDDSVILGTKEVWRSIFAATLTTITVFLPFLFSSNFMIKIIGHHIGVSIISTLTVSLIVALLLIPMITHAFLRRRQAENIPTFQMVSQKNRLIQIYTLLLKTCVRFPARTIVGAVVVFFLSVFICLGLSLNVSQEVESTEFNLYLTMASGATLENTDVATEDLEKRLENIPEKKDIISKIYDEESIVTIKLKDDFEKIRNRSLVQIKGEIQDRIDDFRSAEVSFDQPVSSSRYRGGFGSNPGARFERLLGIGSQSERVVIKGRDFGRMRTVADDVQYYLENLSTIQSARMNINENRPEVHILFDMPILRQYEIGLETIAAELSTFQDEFDSGMTFKQDGEEYEITIRTDQDEDETKPEKTMDDLRKLTIPDPAGGSHELDQLGQMVYATGLSSINRVNQEKQIEITYRFVSEVNSSKSFLTAARLEVDDLIAGLPIPPGIAIEVIHEETDLQEFYFLIGAAFILIYMILASVFESFSTPVVMMFSIPLAAVGSLWALIVTGNSLFNANTLTGFLILLGVVVNNGIILIDYAGILQRRGIRRVRALMAAGQARIRPILITAITTMVAMVPLAMGKAEYISNIGASFAITVIGGLALGTIFTLVFIPTLYSGLQTSLDWLRNLPWKIKIVQGILFIFFVWLIYTKVDNFVWKMANLFLVLLVIPGLTYFLMSSLRQARTTLIRDDESILIKVQNLVKIYDQDRRFVREWKKGKRIQDHAGLSKTYTSWRDFDSYVWQLPLMGFLIYFVYFYLRNGFWMFLLSHLVFFSAFAMWKPLEIYWAQKAAGKKKSRFGKIRKLVYRILYWGIPLFNLIFFQMRWDNIAVVIIIAVIWFLALRIYATSVRLHHEQINIARLTGRFAKFRGRYYRLVRMIPLIGKRKQPFRALNRVSLEIGRGMFGLLGPNGAGKTTLMRMICGILEPSYGKIWINGIDTAEKREELQGLIGYLPQEFGMYENMTAHEFLCYQAQLKGLTDEALREDRVDYVLRSVHMEEHKDRKIGSYSGGMKQRIGIAQILLHLPRILVVDEPTAGLDPRERIRFRNLLVELSRERVVIFSTHIIEDISSSCQRVAVLNRGSIRYLGEPVKMTQFADGKVWHFHVSPEAFESLRKDHMVVHHMRDGDRIRVRCIADKAPVPDAKPARPSLEDAYLCLLKSNGNGDAAVEDLSEALNT